MYAVVVDLATSLEKPSAEMDHHPGQPPDDGSVDADELQVTAHLELDLAGCRIGVPPFHGAGDEVAHFTSVVLDQITDRPFHPSVELALQLRIGGESLADVLEPGQ